ncbi:MAG: hypothetical protein IKL49_10470 [Lachnospiraceae bacterium]|nr:hypothetical protein [Lachnospiraceae bacterium]
MVVQHNLTAMNSNRMLGITTGTQAKSTEKLSSGYKINRAADDAAGLSISEKMRKQIRGLSQASLNAEDGISAVQTAEGALNEVQDMLQRMNELAVKAANGTNSEDDRNYIQDEIDQLVTEIDRVATTTKFNETYLLKGVNANGEAAELTYETAAEALGLEFNDKGKATISAGDPEEDVEFDGDVEPAGMKADSLEPSTYTKTQYEVGDNKYVLISDFEAGTYDIDGGDADVKLSTTAKDVVDALEEADDTVKAFTSKEDLLAAIESDLKETGEVKNVSINTDGSLAVEAFADLNDALAFSLHVGADSTEDNKIEVNISMMSARGLGVNGLQVNGDDDTKATIAIDTITAAIQQVSTQRSALGAVQNRLEHTIANLDNVVENTTAAESQIRDTDMATEMVKYSNNNILAQAGQAMLAQANQANQGVLSLLG